MLQSNEISALDVFQLLMRNLKFNSPAWKILTNAARQVGRGAQEKLISFENRDANFND
jgi:hypothetical protein